MAMKLASRRRLIGEIGTALLQEPDFDFFVEVHGLELPQPLYRGNLLSTLWGLPDTKLLKLVEDLWPGYALMALGAEAGDDQAQWVRELQVSAGNPPASSAAFMAQNSTVLREATERAAHLSSTLHSEVDAGAASEPDVWEFEAKVLDVFLAPAAGRLIMVIDVLVAKADAVTASDLKEAEATVTEEISVLRRIATSLTEPRAVGVANLVLNGARLLLGLGG